MASYQVYNVNINNGEEQTNSLIDMGIISVKGKIKYKQLESIIEEFIKNNFEELYNELIDLVIINTKTKQILHRFNLVFELDDLDNPIDQTLHPFLDVLESEFLYVFLEAYENTYGKEFDGHYKNNYYTIH